jgi:hypothetical protein
MHLTQRCIPPAHIDDLRRTLTEAALPQRLDRVPGSPPPSGHREPQASPKSHMCAETCRLELRANRAYISSQVTICERTGETVVQLGRPDSRPSLRRESKACAPKRVSSSPPLTTPTCVGLLDYAQKIEKRIVLVDGKQLADLMIDDDIGVTLV